MLDEKQARDLIPRLKRRGASGFIEYPLNKLSSLMRGDLLVAFFYSSSCSSANIALATFRSVLYSLMIGQSASAQSRPANLMEQPEIPLVLVQHDSAGEDNADERIEHNNKRRVRMCPQGQSPYDGDIDSQFLPHFPFQALFRRFPGIDLFRPGNSHLSGILMSALRSVSKHFAVLLYDRTGNVNGFHVLEPLQFSSFEPVFYFLYSVSENEYEIEKNRIYPGLIRPQIRKLAAYHVNETPVRIKLDAMENPFPLSQPIRREIASLVKNERINLYPDPSAKELKKSIASLWTMKPEPDDPRQWIRRADSVPYPCLRRAGAACQCPTFAMYEITSHALAQDVVTAPLDENFELDADAVVKKARQSKARVIFLARPNNPTGNRFSEKAIRTILTDTKAVVVIDEAYYSFSGKTWLPRLNKHPNMVILRTLSKIGFAGLRIGVLTAPGKS